MIKQFDDIDSILSDKFHFTGILTLKNTIKEMNYGLYNAEKVENHSLTDFLNHTYNSNTSPLKVIIKELDSGNLNSNIGVLHIAKGDFGIESFHIDNFALEDKLFDLVGEKLEIFIRRLDAVNGSGITEAVEQDGQS